MSKAPSSPTGERSLSITVPTEIAEAVSVFLFESGAGGIEEREHPSEVELVTCGDPVSIARMASQVRDDLKRLAQSEPAAGKSRIVIEEVPSDYRTAWAAGLSAVQLTPSIAVCPSGGAEAVVAPSGRVLRLGVDLVFGYGDHATTRLAASSVEAACRARMGASVLDVGAGTGILSLVAAVSGAERVVGIDTDPRAVLVARSNAETNGVASCDFSTKSLDQLEERFDVVVANLDLATILRLGSEMARLTLESGSILVTGFLQEHAPDVIAAYRDLGFTVCRRCDEAEWTLLELARSRRQRVFD